jgi:hypothetical protein
MEIWENMEKDVTDGQGQAHRRTRERGVAILIWIFGNDKKPIMLEGEKGGLETRVQRLLTCLASAPNS